MTDQKKQITITDLKKTEEIEKTEMSISERFSALVMQEFSGKVGNRVKLSDFQKRLIQNYFISTDSALKTAEERRLKKKEQYRDSLPVIWSNINLEFLAINIVACAKIGYDPALPNHINMVPFKNNKTMKYDIAFIEGYRGRELKAKKYGFEIPDQVIVELKYTNDSFIPIKKDKDNPIETYIFRVSENPFDRGEIEGGFWYHCFRNMPEKNRLMFYSLHEIEKHKPEYAAVEFWGGERATYDDTGKKSGKEKIEGWFAEMCWKTIYRMAYGAITIDSQKIDENLMRILEIERTYEANRLTDTVAENSRLAIEAGANKEEMTMDVQSEDVTGKNGAEEKKTEKKEKTAKKDPSTRPVIHEPDPAPVPEGGLFKSDEVGKPGF
jgi:recombination protein RecT